VTQLRTFAWIRVPAEVKAAVAEEMEREEEAASTTSDPTSATRTRAQGQTQTPQKAERASSSPSPSPSRRTSTSISSSTDTSHDPQVPDSNPASHPRPITSPPTPNPHNYHPSLILDPHKSLALESRYIAHIGTHYLPSLLFLSSSSSSPLPSIPPSTLPLSRPSTSIPPNPTSQPPPPPPPQQQPVPIDITPTDLTETWRSWTKYFNGQHALEKISVREGVKRKRVAAMLGVMEGGGVLRVWRGW